MGGGRHLYFDDEALEDSDIAMADEEDEEAIKSDLDRLLSGGKGRAAINSSDDDDPSTDDDDGSDLKDFIVNDDEEEEGEEEIAKTDRSIYRRHEQRSLCERCRCRLSAPTAPPTLKNSVYRSPSPSSVEVVISGGGSSSVPSSDDGDRLISVNEEKTVELRAGGLLTSSQSSVIGEDDDVAASPISISTFDQGEVGGEPQRRKATPPSRAFSVCRATSVYLQPTVPQCQTRRKKRFSDDSSDSSSTLRPQSTEEKINGNRQTDRIPKKKKKTTNDAADTLFGDIPEEELRQATAAQEPTTSPHETTTSYMAAVGSDLQGFDVRELLRDCSLGSSVLFIQDAWGGESEIFPYREYVKADQRGDSDDVQAHYVKGPRDCGGKGDMFVLVRESIIDEMVPMKFGKRSRHIKVKVFNTKVSMIRARDVAKHMQQEGAADDDNEKLVTEFVTPPKRKRRSEQWHSLKWRRLQTQIAAVREPWLRAARYGGAAYQWRQQLR